MCKKIKPLREPKQIFLRKISTLGEKEESELTVGKVLLVYEMSRQVLPTAPSPTVTHFMNLEALIFSPSTSYPNFDLSREREKERGLL